LVKPGIDGPNSENFGRWCRFHSGPLCVCGIEAGKALWPSRGLANYLATRTAQPSPLAAAVLVQKVKKFSANRIRPESLSKRRVFERECRTEKVGVKSGFNLSQNSFLISTSQKVRVRLSFERAHDD
jgi:hypothetical protein